MEHRPIVSIENMNIKYKQIHAVQNVNFDIIPGQIIGLLGPNGAGKTSIIESIIGLRKPTSGTISVFGLNPWKHRRSIHLWTGIQLQVTSLPDDETVVRFVRLFRHFYPESMNEDDLLSTTDLLDQKNKRIGKLSGGQKQRLVLALALINNPRLVLLDEPTTGLDPAARRSIWDTLTRLKSNNRTIIMATHMMDEAELLCDRILFLNKGEIIEDTTPSNISQKNNTSLIQFRASKSLDRSEIVARLTTEFGVPDSSIFNCQVIPPDKYEITTDKADVVVASLGSWSISENWQLNDLQIKKPSLEDVYIEMFRR
ncbi:ABC transporter ATP-binding protein [Alicyclobacillus sp. SO9]|uniref:ABC transporter ATP-binding protein n=1 Tax=Alicyclobacillus sp. SO9 TaxID=2665646 RepID=UPI0018E7880E|nr:ABC transporter ATP-binding protein [Alicyclobacillus sp. SO9]QQE80168.1 ABC transporter ATP-binding protein [Alicyclobacillus sp. SO9]